MLQRIRRVSWQRKLQHRACPREVVLPLAQEERAATQLRNTVIGGVQHSHGCPVSCIVERGDDFLACLAITMSHQVGYVLDQDNLGLKSGGKPHEPTKQMVSRV